MSGLDVFGRLSPRMGARQAAEVVGAGGLVAHCRSSAMHRWGGAFSSGDVSNATYSIKWMMESDFDQLSFLLLHREATAAAGWSLVAAATETAALTNQDTSFRPVVGGTVYNALRSATDNYGWEALALPDIAAGATLAAPKYSLAAPVSFSTVPRADGGAGRLLMARLYKDGSAGEPKSFRYSTKFDAMRTPNSANRGRIIQMGSVGGNAISNLSTALVLGQQCPPLFPVVRYRRPSIPVAVAADSIGENFNETAEGLTNFIFRACADLSTESLPVIPQNYGLSSIGGATYLAHFKAIAAVSLPAIAFYYPFSPNDLATPTQRSVQDGLARMADFIDFCRTNRIYPIICTPAPNNGYATTPDGFRKYVKDAVLSLAGSWGITVCDFSALGDGATPERYLPGLNADATHPGEVGIETVMVVAARTALRNAIQRLL